MHWNELFTAPQKRFLATTRDPFNRSRVILILYFPYQSPHMSPFQSMTFLPPTLIFFTSLNFQETPDLNCIICHLDLCGSLLCYQVTNNSFHVWSQFIDFCLCYPCSFQAYHRIALHKPTAFYSDFLWGMQTEVMNMNISVYLLVTLIYCLVTSCFIQLVTKMQPIFFLAACVFT